MTGCGSSTGSRTRATWNGWAASNSAAPRYGLVSTANDSGGSRRHHSHSSDWMPADLRREVVRDEQVLHAVTGLVRSRPECRVGVEPTVEAEPGGSPARRVHARSDRTTPGSGGWSRRSVVVGITGVAEHDQCVAPPPSRIAIGEVPPPVPLDQLLVRRLEHVEHVDPGLRVVVEGDGVVATVPHRWRADGLAVVAPVEPIAERLAILERERARAAGPARRGSGWRRRHRAPRSLQSGSRRGSAGTTRTRRPAAWPPSYSAVVTTQPSTNQLPAPGIRMLAFLPNQPMPAR